MRRLVGEMSTIENEKDLDGLVRRIVQVMIAYHEASESAPARMTMLVDIGEVARLVSRWNMDARARAKFILLPVRTTLESRLGRANGPRINAEFVFAFWLPSWPTRNKPEAPPIAPPSGRKAATKSGDPSTSRSSKSSDLRQCS